MRLMTEDKSAAIVRMYGEGRKIRDIEVELGVSRSSIYYELKKQEVTPERAIKPHQRLRGDSHDLSLLYTIIEAQEARIDQLIAALDECGVDIPPEPTKS